MIRRAATTAAPRHGRSGITLLEVVIALAIFLFSMVAIWQLASLGTDRARDVQLHARASMLCQRQLARIVSGIDADGSSGGTFEDAPEWQYEAEVSDAEVDGLKSARVVVRHERADGRVVEVTLTQFFLDPALRGSTHDAATAAAATTPETGTTESTTPMGGTPMGGTP